MKLFAYGYYVQRKDSHIETKVFELVDKFDMSDIIR